MVGLFAGGVIDRKTAQGLESKALVPITYSVTLLVSDLSVPRLPVLANEAHNWIVTRTKLVYMEFFAPG